ncbi:hypothetical protein C8R43DRAFT_1035625 [Mycena crocata]|nr:hypothetical protein C8R43DRAFT_1035625 [Mycena crocata]
MPACRRRIAPPQKFYYIFGFPANKRARQCSSTPSRTQPQRRSANLNCIFRVPPIGITSPRLQASASIPGGPATSNSIFRVPASKVPSPCRRFYASSYATQTQISRSGKRGYKFSYVMDFGRTRRPAALKLCFPLKNLNYFSKFKSKTRQRPKFSIMAWELNSARHFCILLAKNVPKVQLSDVYPCSI